MINTVIAKGKLFIDENLEHNLALSCDEKYDEAILLRPVNGNLINVFNDIIQHNNGICIVQGFLSVCDDIPFIVVEEVNT